MVPHPPAPNLASMFDAMFLARPAALTLSLSLFAAAASCTVTHRPCSPPSPNRPNSSGRFPRTAKMEYRSSLSWAKNADR